MHKNHLLLWQAAAAAVFLLAASASADAQPQPADACSVAAASQDKALVKVPFEIVQGRVYVQAQVNGKGPYRFAVDTGASGLGRADISLVRALHLPVTGSAQSRDAVSTATVDTVHLDSVGLGNLVKSGIDVIARDYSSSVPPDAAISGILARDFFADGLLVIDFPSRTLSFSREARLMPPMKEAVGYERPFRVPVSIGDVATIANLDTGAAVALVLPRNVFKRLNASSLEKAGRARLTNGTLETDRAIVSGPLRVGEMNESNIESRISDHYPEVLIGAQILQHFSIAIDQRSRLVAICNPER